jgi:hypothetical protein
MSIVASARVSRLTSLFNAFTVVIVIINIISGDEYLAWRCHLGCLGVTTGRNLAVETPQSKTLFRIATQRSQTDVTDTSGRTANITNTAQFSRLDVQRKRKTWWRFVNFPRTIQIPSLSADIGSSYTNGLEVPRHIPLLK